MVLYSLDRERTRENPNADFHSNGEPAAVFYKDYRKRLLEVEKRLKIGEEIPLQIVSELKIRYWLVGNNNLKPDSLQLKPLDCMPLGVVIHPGKSVHINFVSECEVTTEKICLAMLNRPKERQDRLWEADPEILERKGFVGYWAPTHSAPLHVRLVWVNHIDNPSNAIENGHLRDLQRSFRQICRK